MEQVIGVRLEARESADYLIEGRRQYYVVYWWSAWRRPMSMHNTIPSLPSSLPPNACCIAQTGAHREAKPLSRPFIRQQHSQILCTRRYHVYDSLVGYIEEFVYTSCTYMVSVAVPKISRRSPSNGILHCFREHSSITSKEGVHRLRHGRYHRRRELGIWTVLGRGNRYSEVF